MPEGGSAAAASQSNKSERTSSSVTSSAAPPAAEENSLDNVDADSEESSASASASASNVPAGTTSVRSSIRVAVPVNLPASTTIQHHVLPAEVIPLPLTISTLPGLRTIIAPETITIHQPTVTKVGELVQKIPTAVSHQSQTIVHKHARVVTPIVAPAIRTLTSQVVRAYHTPLLLNAHVPVVKIISN